MSGDIQVLSDYLMNDLKIQGNAITSTAIQAKITEDSGSSNPTGKVTIPIDVGQYVTTIDKVENLTKLKNLSTLEIYDLPKLTDTFTTNSLSTLDGDTSINLKNIYLDKNNICIAPHNYFNLKNINIDYVHSNHKAPLHQTLSRLSNQADPGADPKANTVCPKVDKTNPKFVVIGLDPCTDQDICGGSGGTQCIQSVEIKNSNLVITTGSCSPTSSSTLNTPVSESPEISYSSCTSCGNNKTLLRNKVDEVKDDSSLLYNRDSNNEVCNHCLVSIGDEKHCNRFLEKEECNYLGDSYNWVGA